MRVSRRADASWRLGLNQCIMLGSRVAGDLTERRLRYRVLDPVGLYVDHYRREGVKSHWAYALESKTGRASRRPRKMRCGLRIVHGLEARLVLSSKHLHKTPYIGAERAHGPGGARKKCDLRP